MTVKLLLSQPAGGKTSFCIDEIRRIREKDPMSPIKVIVPDKMQMAYWKKTLAEKSKYAGRGSGFIGTEIISFTKLAMEILNDSPESPMLIPLRLDSLCIREAIENAFRAQPFAYFAPIREKPGLISLFEQTIHTLQHGRVTPEMLEEVSSGDPKAADTARVYREYIELLQKNNWTGSAGLLNAAAERLEKNRSGFTHCPLLSADGFDELTNDCLNLLRVLSPFCDEILITLPANSGSDDPTDMRIKNNAEKICKKLNAEIIYPKTDLQKSEILRLTDRVFTPVQNAPDSAGKKMNISDNSFLMIEASSKTTEVREALRELKRRIVMNKLHPADCAVFTPDMTAYTPILRQYGREMGIPLRFSQKQSLSETPAASALKRLLRLAPDFETMEVLSVLRLPFFSGCPDPEDTSGGNYSADLFVVDQIGRKMNVISGTEEWKSAFSEALKSAPDSLPGGAENSEDPDEGRIFEYPEKKKLERIQNSFLKITELLTPPSDTHPRSEWTTWLENLLQTIRFYEQIEDRGGRSFEADFKALLKRIVFCEEKLNRPAASYEEFLSELESEIDAAAQTEPEFVGDRVFVGDISQTSGCRWKLIVLTGFAEGTFPCPEHEDLILTDSLREKLGLLRQTDQQLLFRHALTRSDTGLIITRPQKTDKGEEWPPSIYWQTVREYLEENANLHSVMENTPVTAASPDEYAFRLARSGRKDFSPAEEDSNTKKIRDLLDTAWKELEILQEQKSGKYSHDSDPDLKSALEDPVKDAVPYSCSAIETWLTCPFKYFLMRKLKLEQPQEPGAGMDAAQIGSLNHKVLELTFAPGTVYSSKEEALKKADENITKVFADAPREFGFRESELWEFEKTRLRQKLLDTIERMFTAQRTCMPVNSSWKSVGTETEFGYQKKDGSSTDPLTIETDAGPIRIRGIIDRIDMRDDGLLRVVDYKTGFGSFKPEALKAGAHIQAGVYAAAVVHALRMGTKCEGMYWGINDKSAREPVMYDSEQNDDIPNIGFLNKFAEGIRDAAFRAEPAGGDCPDYCPAAAWCRKFVGRKKYG